MVASDSPFAGALGDFLDLEGDGASGERRCSICHHPDRDAIGHHVLKRVLVFRVKRGSMLELAARDDPNDRVAKAQGQQNAGGGSGLSGFEGICQGPGEKGRAGEDFGGGGSRPGNYRDYRPGGEGGRPGAVVRAGQRVEDSGGDESFGERAAHVYSAGSGYARRSGGASAFVSGCEITAGNFGKSEDAAEAGGDWVVFSEDGAQRRVPGSGAHGKLLARLFSDTEMLAAGWRTLHHLADGDYEKP